MSFMLNKSQNCRVYRAKKHRLDETGAGFIDEESRVRAVSLAV